MQLKALRRLSCCFIACLTASLSLHAHAANDLLWHEPDAIARVVCTPDSNPPPTTILTRIPLPEGINPEAIQCIAREFNDDTLPTRTITTTSPPEIWVTTQRAKATTKPFFIYCLGTPAPTPAECPPLTNTVSVLYRRFNGVSKPNTWERYLYMFNNGAPLKNHQAEHANFSPYTLELPPQLQNKDKKEQNKHLKHLSHTKLCTMESWINCPKTGTYTFALKTHDPAFLVIDGSCVLTYLPEHARNPVTDEWGLAIQHHLPMGPHRFQLFTISNRSTTTTVGWIPPGQEIHAPITPIPAALCMGTTTPASTQIEWRENIIHPAATIDPLPTYRFLGSPTLFAPLAIKNLSRSWASETCSSSWYTDGKPLPLDNAAGGIARLPLMENRTLELFALDPLGFHGTMHLPAPTFLGDPVEYAIDLTIGNIPAVCFADDAIWPELQLMGSMDNTIEITATWKVFYRNQPEPATGSATLKSLSRDRQTVALPRLVVGSVEQVEWEIQHASISLEAGRIRFLNPPFDDLPTRVHEQALLANNGDQLVLVPFRYAGDYTQPAIHLSQAFGNLLCVDDQITIDAPANQTPYGRTLAHLIDGPDRPLVTLTRIPHHPAPHTATYAPLVKFPWFASLNNSYDVIILSMSNADILTLPNVEAFERHAAALTDLISTTRHQRIIWVTPPPPMDAAFPMRPYAAAIQRVCDARRIPVADLYTACLTRYGGPNRARSGSAALDHKMQDLAALLVARALLARIPDIASHLTTDLP